MSKHDNNSSTLTSIYLADERATLRFGGMLARATHSKPEHPYDGEDGKELSPCPATIGGKIYLSGELGAGKTTLTRGIMRGYGYIGAVKSPTYTLVEPYELQGCNIYHFDFYRLADPEEMEFLGVWDYFADSNLCIIEWPERGKGFLPRPDIDIALTLESRGRRITWQARSDLGREISQRLVDLCRNL